MENASKALIIAASILLAIMIIALGVTIFNKAQSSADTTSLDTAEINMFNSKFERYSGEQLGSQVKSLISFAISNASKYKGDPSCLPTITLPPYTANGGTNATVGLDTYINSLSDIRNSVVSTTTYTVKCSYSTTGLISLIEISK